MKASVFVLIISLTCFFCPAQSDGQLHPKAPAVPEYIEFAGKKIRFDRDDIMPVAIEVFPAPLPAPAITTPFI